jgi:hypothetical protein
MANIKLAFERYMDFLIIQRRESMLKWSLEFSSSIGYGNSNSYNLTKNNSEWKQSIFTSQLIKSLLHPELRNSVSIKKHLNLIKRDFTSTTTKFFDNNFDIIVENDTSSIDLKDQGKKRFNNLCEELKYFNNETPESFTPDIIINVSKTFDWLYSNKQYKLCYELLGKIKPNYNYFFKFNHYGKMIEIFDRFGEPNDLFQFCEVFKYEKIPNIWRKLDRLTNDQLISQLIKLSDVKSFTEAKPLLLQLLKNDIEGLKFFSLRVSSSLYKDFDEKSRIEFYDYLTTLDVKYRKYFPPSLIIQIFETYSSTINGEFNLQYQFLENFIKPNHHPDNVTGSSSFAYRVLSSLPKGPLAVLKFKIWYNFCYNDEKLKYDREIEPIIYLRNNKMHFLPKNFEKQLDLNTSDLSTVFSILIYTFSRYENVTTPAQMFYHIKEKLNLNITRSDKVGYLKSLTSSKKYEKAHLFLKKCLDENPKFESPETLNPILIVLAKNKKWSQLEDIYTDRYKNNEVITKDQYTTLFIALSIRPGTNKIIMELWENYIRRGFEPTDQVLSSIILSFINTKSYEDALQWFSAYSHYKVELTSKSYGLMLHALTGTRNIESVFKVLDELAIKQVRLPKIVFTPVFVLLSMTGDYKSIEMILINYYPKFNLDVERDDSRWIMQCHYHAQRFNIIVDTYLNMKENEILYKDSLLALESSLKYSNISTFEKVWNKSFNIHHSRGDLDIASYIYYMSYWIRKYGGFGIEIKLKEIKEILKIKEFPTSLFNQMIFSAFRTNRPWLTKRILKIGILNNVIPSPKTYSLILQSNVCMPWIARNSIDQTIEILEEFLKNRKEDKFGKLNDDINPMSFKLVMKAIIKYKNIDEARKLFELYLEQARNNLENNIHILNIELMLLGEEERWIEFDQYYDKYLQMITKLHDTARLRDKNTIERHDFIGNFRRLNYSKDIYLRKNYDENKITNLEDARVKIPNWIKKSHYDLWIYRLKQLQFADKLDEINSLVDNLLKRGIVLSNKNLNETALFLSSRSELLEEAASFIDKFILPWHIKNKSMKMMKLRYRTNEIPGMRKPIYEFSNEIYFQVIKNLSISLDERLTPEQRESFFKGLSSNSNIYIMKNMTKLLEDRRHIRSSYLQIKKMRTTFYRNIRNRIKGKKIKAIKRSYMWKVDEAIEYSRKMNILRSEMNLVVSKIRDISEGCNKSHHRLIAASNEMLELKNYKKEVFGHIKVLQKQKEEKIKELIDQESKKGEEKKQKVGRLDLFNF